MTGWFLPVALSVAFLMVSAGLGLLVGRAIVRRDAQVPHDKEE